jgi:type VI secretion system protein
MQNLSLYNILVGYFTFELADPSNIDPSFLDNLSEEKKIRHSIVENLTMVLRSRRGSILHMPDFGLPDVMHAYIDSGYSFDTLKKDIRETILKYEPRIANVRVETPQLDNDNMNIFLKIVVTIKDYMNKEILLTEFSSTGWTKVVFERDRK